MRYERPAVLLVVFVVGFAVWRLVALWLAAGPGVALAGLEATDCWFDIPTERTAHCGYLTVSNHRDRAMTTYSRIAVAVFTPAGGVKRGDPVLFLSGGPGGAFGFVDGKGWWWNWIDAVALSQGREFIAMDQRGVGRSQPRVDCPGLRVLEGRLMQREIAPEEEDRQWLDAVDSCRERLLRRGTDFSTFGSGESAADVDELRRALGVAQWNLYGISYGTRLALAVARDHPEGVRSLVLDSVYPPDAQTLVDGPPGLDHALRLCWSACPECEGMTEVLERVIDQLNQKPVHVRFVHPTSLEKFDVVLDGDRLIDALIVELSGHADVHKLAESVAGLDRGDAHAASGLVRDLWIAMQDADFSYPVNYSVECREEIPFNGDGSALAHADRFPMVARHERRDADTSQRICALWGVAPVERESEPVRTDLPTLILAGAFDPVTPMVWAEHVLELLPKAQLFSFMAGHSVTDADPCALEIIAAFINDPARRPSVNCYPKSDSRPVQRP